MHTDIDLYTSHAYTPACVHEHVCWYLVCFFVSVCMNVSVFVTANSVWMYLCMCIAQQRQIHTHEQSCIHILYTCTHMCMNKPVCTRCMYGCVYKMCAWTCTCVADQRLLADTYTQSLCIHLTYTHTTRVCTRMCVLNIWVCMCVYVCSSHACQYVSVWVCVADQWMRVDSYE